MDKQRVGGPFAEWIEGALTCDDCLYYNTKLCTNKGCYCPKFRRKPDECPNFERRPDDKV